MRKRHVVELWGPNKDGSFSAKQSRRFTSLRSATQWAERMNDRHCGAARSQYTRWIPWVEYRDAVTGQGIELARPTVLSVGELGWW